MGFKQIIGSIFILVAAMLIFSFIVNPIKRAEAKDYFLDMKSKISNNIEISKGVKPIRSKCISEIEERIYYLKKRASSTVRINILESKHFNNTQDAIDYLDKWGFSKPSAFSFGTLTHLELYNQSWGIPKNTIIEYDNLTIAIIKIENYIELSDVAVTIPLLCIDEELTEKSIQILRL